jgi:hypothetical protein
MEYFWNIAEAANEEDGDLMGTLLISSNANRTIHSLTAEQIQSDFNIPRDLKPVLERLLLLKKCYMMTFNAINVFNETSELLKALNRYAENKNNWAVKPLVIVTKELISAAVQADKYIEKNPAMFASKNIGDFEHEHCLTKAARVIHSSFKLCLNDRNENNVKSRRQYTYFFVGQELKIYYKLQNRDLAKNMEKVLTNFNRSLPDLLAIEKSHAVTYLYYSGIIFCGDGDFEIASKKFKLAFQLCDKKDTKHIEAILMYLVPLKFVITRKYPNLKLLSTYRSVFAVYKEIIRSVVMGDLKRFDREFDTLELFFLKKNLYLTIENMRQYVLLKLIKKVYQFNGGSSHLSIKAITRGIEFSKYHTNNREIATRNLTNFSSDEAECLMANLIFQGFIKGYISHSNGVVVLSKKQPFPRQVKEDP